MAASLKVTFIDQPINLENLCSETLCLKSFIETPKPNTTDYKSNITHYGPKITRYRQY